MNIYQSNIQRKDLSWINSDDESRVQERQQVKEQQIYWVKYCWVVPDLLKAPEFLLESNIYNTTIRRWTRGSEIILEIRKKAWILKVINKPIIYKLFIDFTNHKKKTNNPANIYLFKVNNRNTIKKCEICSKLTIKTPERRHWCRSGVLIVNFELLVFLLLPLNKQVNISWEMFTGRPSLGLWKI